MTNRMKKLIERPELEENKKAFQRYQRLENLLQAIEKRDWQNGIPSVVNHRIETLNQISSTEKNIAGKIKEHQNLIIQELEKNHKIVPKNFYRRKWLSLGVGALGVPIGFILGKATGNMGLFGIGMPIGLGIGSILGMSMDKKASRENRQLDFESVD